MKNFDPAINTRPLPDDYQLPVIVTIPSHYCYLCGLRHVAAACPRCAKERAARAQFQADRRLNRARLMLAAIFLLTLTGFAWRFLE